MKLKTTKTMKKVAIIGGTGMSYAGTNHIKGQLEKGLAVTVVNCKSSTDDISEDISEEMSKTIIANCNATVILKVTEKD